MRWISFMHTAPQMRSRTKTVTRRTGWANLQPGTLLHAAERTRGLTLAEREAGSLGVIRVVSVRRERLGALTKADLVAEGFPDLAQQVGGREQFLVRFKQTHGCQLDDKVTRIEFAFMDE